VKARSVVAFSQRTVHTVVVVVVVVTVQGGILHWRGEGGGGVKEGCWPLLLIVFEITFGNVEILATGPLAATAVAARKDRTSFQ
jgi:hypothetical protein